MKKQTTKWIWRQLGARGTYIKIGWIYNKNKGIFVPEGKSCIKEICRDILGEIHTSQLMNMVVEKIVADTFIEPQDFFNSSFRTLILTRQGHKRLNKKV